jgi:paraquat-inducible protein B
MAKQANRMMIGGFVVTAIFLFMISLVVFGSGRFFNRTETFVLHFDGSIKGLQVGSPVLFQGVQIGSVTSIVIQTHEDDLKASIPVTIQIEPQKFEMGSSRRALTTPEETLPQLIALGLRGVLTLQSFITGQLMIEFDFYPDSQAVYRDTDKEYIEIPTIKSSTERLAQSLQQLDIEGLEKDVKSVLEGIDNVNRRVDALADRLEETLVDVDTLVNNINSRVDPLATGTETAIRAYTQLAEDTDVKLQNLMSDLDETLLAARDIMSPDATLMVDLRTTLEEISDAARSFRLLADYLAQHPEALIQGKTN